MPALRTTFKRAWYCIGVDLAGPISYKLQPTEAKTSTKRRGRLHVEYGKAWFVLMTCSATRGVHLEIVKSQSAAEFQRVLRNFMVRRDRPHVIYSDNGGNFKSTAEWLKILQQDEDTHNYLAKKISPGSST